MKILVQSNRTLADLQKDFQEIFPYLKLEFYAAQHKAGIKSHRLSTELSLANCRHNKEVGLITIRTSDTVRHLEDEFREKFGLYAQVFRKSGNMWIETSLTDGWTLLQQNQEGRALSEVNIKEEEKIFLNDSLKNFGATGVYPSHLDFFT